MASKRTIQTSIGFCWHFETKLFIDEKLKMSNENFKQTIDDFFKDKIITPLNQPTLTPALPAPHVLVQFASKTHKC